MLCSFLLGPIATPGGADRSEDASRAECGVVAVNTKPPSALLYSPSSDAGARSIDGAELLHVGVTRLQSQDCGLSSW